MKRILMISAVLSALASCSKDKDPIIIVPPSSGSTMTLNGLTGEEDPNSSTIGSDAKNSVFIDFSSDLQTSVKRNSWDLGFYSGADFKVILNNTNGASAVLVNKTDIGSVTEADVDLNILKLGQGAGTFAIIDDPREPNILNKTAIATVSATDGENKVYVINIKGGTNGSITPVDSIFKIRILRKGSGYSLQYAKLRESSFKTLDVAKNVDYNFQFASLFSGALVNVEPLKTNWDIIWGWSVYFTGTFPYSFSDMVYINNLAGVSAFERVYTDATTATTAYTNFNKDSAAKYSFVTKRDVIGSNWRFTTGTIGTKKDRFYVVKDAAGNVYKLKFISFSTQDGGTRGKPLISYELLK